MRQYDMEKIRKELIEIYSEYKKDPNDPEMKRKARMLHTAYGNTGPHMEKIMRHAINLLVDIGWDLPAPPKPSKEVVETLIFALASGNA